MKRLILVLLILSCNVALAQKLLSLNEFYSVIKNYHPVARQAGINIQIAKSEIRTARGAFDPVFQMTQSQKEFDGIYYYDQQLTELKIPSWYGIELQAGTETLSGDRTWTTETKGKSSYAGFSIPLARNLLMDKRRAALATAKIAQQSSLQEQRALINDLLLEATKAYWTWWQSEENIKIYRASLENAQQRFVMIKTAYLLGDRAAIDTLEALTQVQSLQMKLMEGETDVINNRLQLSTFLWSKDEMIYELPAGVLPVSPTPEPVILPDLLQSSGSHPSLLQYQYKLKTLQVDKQLKFQSLLPIIQLKYNQLGKSHDLWKSVTTPWMQNNYRYGINISLPLRLSEGRGEYQKANLKLMQVKLEQLNKTVLIQNKTRQQYNEWQQLLKQAGLQEKAVATFEQLQTGEEQKLFNGESSLFLVNARQVKALEAKQKLVELQGKAAMAFGYLKWNAGILE